MRIAVTGSIATDHLMTFPGRFADQLVPIWKAYGILAQSVGGLAPTEDRAPSDHLEPVVQSAETVRFARGKVGGTRARRLGLE